MKKFKRLMTQTVIAFFSLSISICISYIGVRCVTEGDSIQIGLGWTLIGLGLVTLLGGAYCITEQE